MIVWVYVHAHQSRLGTHLDPNHRANTQSTHAPPTHPIIHRPIAGKHYDTKHAVPFKRGEGGKLSNVNFTLEEIHTEAPAKVRECSRGGCVCVFVSGGRAIGQIQTGGNGFRRDLYLISTTTATLTKQTNRSTQLAALAKSVGVKRFIHVSALGADEASPVRWLRTKAKVG